MESVAIFWKYADGFKSFAALLLKKSFGFLLWDLPQFILE